MAVLMASVVGLGCGGDGDDAPSCESMIDHIDEVGCYDGSQTREQRITRCEEISATAEEMCAAENEAVLACAESLPSGLTQDQCDATCNDEGLALIDCLNP